MKSRTFIKGISGFDALTMELTYVKDNPKP